MCLYHIVLLGLYQGNDISRISECWIFNGAMIQIFFKKCILRLNSERVLQNKPFLQNGLIMKSDGDNIKIK